MEKFSSGFAPSDPAAVPAVVSGDGHFPHVVVLDGAVDGVAVVDEKGDAAAIAPVGADADVIHVAENDDVARLPLRGIVETARQHLCVAAEIGVEVCHAAEVDVWVGRGDVRIGGGRGENIAVDEILEIVPGGLERLPDDVQTPFPSLG